MNNTTDWELIASLEGEYETGSSSAELPNIWYFTLNQTTGAVTGEGIELHTSNFLSSQLSAIESQSVHITYGIAPYNSGGMVPNTRYGRGQLPRPSHPRRGHVLFASDRRHREL